MVKYYAEKEKGDILGSAGKGRWEAHCQKFG
jgi:hypothetical protein